MPLEIPIQVTGLQKAMQELQTARSALRQAERDAAGLAVTRNRAAEQGVRAAERMAAQTARAADRASQAEVKAAEKAAAATARIREQQNQANAAYWQAKERFGQQQKKSSLTELASGPYQAAQKAAGNLSLALAGGTPQQIRDAGILHEKRQKALARAERPEESQLQKALGTAVRSSRFEMRGGHINAVPLAGRSLDVLAALGPLGEAAGGAAAALTAMGAAALAAAAGVNSETRARFTSGGTPTEQGRLGALGNSVGLSGGDMASLSREFAERRSSARAWRESNETGNLERVVVLAGY